MNEWMDLTNAMYGWKKIVTLVGMDDIELVLYFSKDPRKGITFPISASTTRIMLPYCQSRH